MQLIPEFTQSLRLDQIGHGQGLCHLLLLLPDFITPAEGVADRVDPADKSRSLRRAGISAQALDQVLQPLAIRPRLCQVAGIAFALHPENGGQCRRLAVRRLDVRQLTQQSLIQG